MHRQCAVQTVHCQPVSRPYPCRRVYPHPYCSCDCHDGLNNGVKTGRGAIFTVEASAGFTWAASEPEPRRVPQGKVTGPSLVYEGRQELLYFQAEPPLDMRLDDDLGKPPVSCLLDPDDAGR